MTDYNDGKWHGWNGGECPVDRKAKVEMVYTSPQSTAGFFNVEGYAGDRRWEWDGKHRAIAFRVTKPAPPKPREWWTTSQIMHDTEEKAETFRNKLLAENPSMDFPPIVHVREVLP